MALLDPLDKSVEGFTVIDIDPNFRLVDQIDARAAKWTPDGWQLSDGAIRRMGAGNRLSSEVFDSRLVTMPEHIDDFIQVQDAPETMSFLELRAYVARLRHGGHQVGKYVVQLYAKLSFPLVNVIMRPRPWNDCSSFVKVMPSPRSRSSRPVNDPADSRRARNG